MDEAGVANALESGNNKDVLDEAEYKILHTSDNVTLG